MSDDIIGAAQAYAYPVSAVFKSLQGEGHFVGYPMVFIRLAGCSVSGCAIRKECDEAPWKMTERVTAADLARRAWQMAASGIAVITGGEPTDHDLVPLVDLLHSYGMRVHLETSGVRAIEGCPVDWLTVSPKELNYPQRTGHTLKVVVRPGWGWQEITALDRETTFFHRYLQPMTALDGTNNLSEVIGLLATGSAGARWALSTQAHRTWGVK
jgi:organic radical activating enzyme